MNFFISGKVEDFRKKKPGKWVIFAQYLLPLSLSVALNVLHLLEKTISNCTTKLSITSFPKNREIQKLKWISIYASSKKTLPVVVQGLADTMEHVALMFFSTTMLRQ